MDLDRPYHRSLLRTLYKVGENLQLKPADTCYDISYAPGQFTLPSLPGPTGVWPVPTSGRLDLSFSIEKAIQRAVKGVAEENFGEVLAKYNEVMRFLAGCMYVAVRGLCFFGPNPHLARAR